MPLNWNHSKALAKTRKAFLVDALGVREAFLVVQAGGRSFPALVWAAIPKHEKLNVPMLKAALKDKSFLVRETGDFCFIAMLGASLASRVNLANVGPNGAAARQEFLEAHQVVKDYPVQVLIAPPKYMKKVFRETKPTLPGALEKIDLASMADALRWKAIGVSPEKMEFLVVAEAESENNAQSLYRNGSDLFSHASEELISWLRKYKETPRDKNSPGRDAPSKPISNSGTLPDELLGTLIGAYPEIINEESLKQLGQFLIPKPEGKRFVVKGSGDTLQKLVDKGSPLLLAMLHKVIESERNRQRSMLPQNRLKQIGLAMHNYLSAHTTFPPPYSADKNGRPLHSWRVLILPYLEEYRLAQKSAWTSLGIANTTSNSTAKCRASITIPHIPEATKKVRPISAWWSGRILSAKRRAKG